LNTYTFSPYLLDASVPTAIFLLIATEFYQLDAAPSATSSLIYLGNFLSSKASKSSNIFFSFASFFSFAVCFF
jgi:hypothetical protein